VATTIQEIQELIDGCLKNNREAQRRLYEKYAPAMMGVCMRYSGTREKAEDVLMDGFTKVFQNLSSFKGDSSLDSWIRAIMVKTAISHFRAEKKHLQQDDLDDNEAAAAVNSGQESSIITKLEAKQVMEMVAQMPDDLRVIFNMRLVEDYSFRDIAQALDRNENTVRVYYQRARQWIQNQVKTRFIASQ